MGITLGIFQAIKSKKSFIEKEVKDMGPGEGAPKEALDGAQ